MWLRRKEKSSRAPWGGVRGRLTQAESAGRGQTPSLSHVPRLTHSPPNPSPLQAQRTLEACHPSLTHPTLSCRNTAFTASKSSLRTLQAKQLRLPPLQILMSTCETQLRRASLTSDTADSHLLSSSPIFVTWNTLNKNSGSSRLRGCIGTFSPVPLTQGLSDYAKTR